MDKIKALIDTNVLLDHLAHREGFFHDANNLGILVMTPAEFVQKVKE